MYIRLFACKDFSINGIVSSFWINNSLIDDDDDKV